MCLTTGKRPQLVDPEAFFAAGAETDGSLPRWGFWPARQPTSVDAFTALLQATLGCVLGPETVQNPNIPEDPEDCWEIARRPDQLTKVRP